MMLPLRNLLKSDVFEYNSSHVEAFEKVKRTISSAVMLNHFNPTFKTVVQVDASQTGFGAALIQICPETEEERIISFPYRTLGRYFVYPTQGRSLLYEASSDNYVFDPGGVYSIASV